jgi:hypothetical protein
LQLVVGLREAAVTEEYLNNAVPGNRRSIEAAAATTKAYQELAKYILGLQKKLKADRRPPKKGAPSLESLTRRLMKSLDEETRFSIMREFCLGCGSSAPNCHCQNDE